jgi:RNA polymerase sigma-70 factor (ECF subfamily)
LVERVDEKAVILRVQEGDANAFEILYRRYLDRIYPLALRMSGNALRAEELTQDIFVRAWEKIRLFKGKSSFFTWLYRLAVNFLLQSERSRKRSDAHVMFREPSKFSRSPGLNFEVETRMEIEQALSRLPKKARAVLILHELEGMTHLQISQLADISPGTSKAQLHRARKLLKEELSR